MGFWIFMTTMNLLIPLTMIGFGKYFKDNSSKRIYGYRTSMSMKNEDTIQFAHNYCGRLWLRLGWPLLILSLVSMLILLGEGNKHVGIYGGIISGIQVMVLIISIIPIELALRKTFNKSGKRL
ncbi:SdpI family protein [Acidaminobacter sp. JC074]|uniref:SdpI family protein n=1 Tax=Acidaminobacter sp. JC074 TaxID=2530199 RepID=UPI001F0EB0C5|nr:SdpI family protein [Acidaminobacter sp. JC074]MCH4890593.1 SdpI family protein [Acidaminobacter sp. JC074]